MANTKTTDEAAATTLDGTELYRGVQAAANVKVTGAQIATQALGISVAAQTDKATPVDADVMPLSDSAASNVPKKVTWANIKATLKAYFDTLYLSGSWAVPGTIGSTTPNTGAFTTISATGAISTTVGTVTSSVANGAAAKAFSFNTSGAYTSTAKLASWANNSVEKASIQQDGTFTAAVDIVSTTGNIVTANGQLVYQATAFALGQSIGLRQRSTFMVGWSSSSSDYSSVDTTLFRGAAGRVDVCQANSSTPGDIKVRSYLVDATNTAGGTTGNQTINKGAGTVNFAASATSLVVTNSLVSTSSLVFCTIRTNDTTAVIKNVVPAAGSFTITLNAAATAETSVGFIVHN